MFLFIFSFSIRNYWFSCLATQWNCLENWNYQCWDSNHTEFNITGMCRVLHHIIYFLNIYWFERETGWREGGREREKKRGREREREHQFFMHLAFPGWFLYVPWPQIESATLACQDVALTNLATQPGRMLVLKSILADFDVQSKIRTTGLILVEQGLEHCKCSKKVWQMTQHNDS